LGGSDAADRRYGEHPQGPQFGYQDTLNETPTTPPLIQVLPLPSTIDTTTRGWAVNLRSNLFSWTNWMQIKAASAEVAQAEANYQAAEQDLILRVATAYFLVLSAEAGVEANTAALEAITHASSTRPTSASKWA